MALRVSVASVDDVDRIAEIHLAAFDSNPLLHVQFPSPSSLQVLKFILARGMRRVIEAGESSGKVVLVARDKDMNDAIISFAKWDMPVLGEDAEHDAKVDWPADCQTEYLDKYHQLTDAMQKRVMGDRPCYRMTFVGTDPLHCGKGAATLLTRWGVDRADAAGLPVYLEATIEAVSMYQKIGFISCDELLLPLPAIHAEHIIPVYKEIGMLREARMQHS